MTGTHRPVFTARVLLGTREDVRRSGGGNPSPVRQASPDVALFLCRRHGDRNRTQDPFWTRLEIKNHLSEELGTFPVTGTFKVPDDKGCW